MRACFAPLARFALVCVHFLARSGTQPEELNEPHTRCRPGVADCTSAGLYASPGDAGEICGIARFAERNIGVIE